jgi:hypothetical protein
MVVIIYCRRGAVARWSLWMRWRSAFTQASIYNSGPKRALVTIILSGNTTTAESAAVVARSSADSRGSNDRF